MLLDTLLRRHRGMTLHRRHNPADFHPLSFETGAETPHGTEVVGTTWKRARRSGKNYRLVGYLR